MSASIVERTLLRLWARTDIAPGYRYAVTEMLSPKQSRTFMARLPNGCFIACDLSEHVDRHIYFQGAYEPIESYLLFQMLKPGMVFLDVGANIGQYTLLASTRVGPDGEVHSFEPIPGNWSRLAHHVRINGLTNVVVNQRALWSRSAHLAAGLSEDTVGNSGCYRIQQCGQVPVEAVSLDEYARNLTRLDIMKIDVEGAEPHVLRGAQNTLQRFRPVLFIEVNRAALEEGNMDVDTLWASLKDLGYRVWRIGLGRDESGEISSFDSFEQSNIIAHVADLPSAVTENWTVRTALKWARTGW